MRTESIKLDHFTADIMSEVADKKQKIEELTAKEIKTVYEAKELQYLEEAYNIIQSGLKLIDQEKTEVVSKTQMENKIKILHKRKEIMDQVFIKAKEKIEEYTHTEEYKTSLLATIKKDIEFLGVGEYKIYINYNDRLLCDLIQETFKDAEVIVEEKHVEMLGGCKLLNSTTNIFLNDSISKKLEKEKEDFLQYTSIEIEEEVGV